MCCICLRLGSFWQNIIVNTVKQSNTSDTIDYPELGVLFGLLLPPRYQFSDGQIRPLEVVSAFAIAKFFLRDL